MKERLEEALAEEKEGEKGVNQRGIGKRDREEKRDRKEGVSKRVQDTKRRRSKKKRGPGGGEEEGNGRGDNKRRSICSSMLTSLQLTYMSPWFLR